MFLKLQMNPSPTGISPSKIHLLEEVLTQNAYHTENHSAIMQLFRSVSNSTNTSQRLQGLNAQQLHTFEQKFNETHSVRAALQALGLSPEAFGLSDSFIQWIESNQASGNQNYQVLSEQIRSFSERGAYQRATILTHSFHQFFQNLPQSYQNILAQARGRERIETTLADLTSVSSFGIIFGGLAVQAGLNRLSKNPMMQIVGFLLTPLPALAFSTGSSGSQNLFQRIITLCTRCDGHSPFRIFMQSSYSK